MAKKTTNRKKPPASGEAAPGPQRFFEIVNWKAAQPNMTGRNNPWLKLYTSLLDNDGFANLDDTQRMLIIALWLYAARAGRSVFPADPKWLRRKIPMLNHDPDLGPLIAAVDDCGVPTPFVRYCEPPAAEPAGRKKTGKAAKKRAGKKQQAEESRTEESREEESREEESRKEQNPKAERRPARRGVAIGKRVSSAKTKTRVSAEQGASAGKSRSRKSTAEQKPAEPAEQSPSQATAEQSTQQPAEPGNPTNPDALGRSKTAEAAEPAPGSVKPPGDRRRNRNLSSAARYDRYDIQFARRIFFALHLPGDPDNGAIDETTSLASVWREVRQYCRAPPDEDRFGMRLLKEAAIINKRAKPGDNKAAIWNANARKIAAGLAAK